MTPLRLRSMTAELPRYVDIPDPNPTSYPNSSPASAVAASILSLIG